MDEKLLWGFKRHGFLKTGGKMNEEVDGEMKRGRISLVIVQASSDMKLRKNGGKRNGQFNRCGRGFFTITFAFKQNEVMYALCTFRNWLCYPTRHLESEVFIELLKRSASRSNTMRFSKTRTKGCVATSLGQQTANHD